MVRYAHYELDNLIYRPRTRARNQRCRLQIAIDDAGTLTNIELSGVNAQPASDARPILGRYLVSPPPTRIENSAGESWCFEWLVDDHRAYTFRYQRNGVWQEIAIPALPQDPRLVQRTALEGLYVAGHAVGRIVQLHLNLAYQQGGIPIERDTLGGTTVMWFSLSHPLYRTTLHEDANYYYIKLYDAAGAELPPNTPINTYLTLHILNERG